MRNTKLASALFLALVLASITGASAAGLVCDPGYAVVPVGTWYSPNGYERATLFEYNHYKTAYLLELVIEHRVCTLEKRSPWKPVLRCHWVVVALRQWPLSVVPSGVIPA